MDAVTFAGSDSDFAIVIRPAGWLSQWLKLLPAAVLFALALSCKNDLFQLRSEIDDRGVTSYELPMWPVWLGAFALVAAAFQGAYRRVTFTADSQRLVIASGGPLRRKIREYPRGALQAAIVGDSNTSVGGRYLKQLKLYFLGHNAPQTMLTGRNEADLQCIARYLTQALDLGRNCHSSTEYMEVRRAPLHAASFRLIFGIGTAVAFALMFLQWVTGIPVAGIGIFVAVIIALAISFYITHKARCPKCGAEIRMDSLSPEGNCQYTCATCRIVWQSPIRVARRRL